MGRSINLEGKCALITGGTWQALCAVLSQAGARVVLASRRTERLKELRAEIEASGGAAHVVSLNVTDYQSIKSAVAHAETEAGTIDILVNNSGVSTQQKLTDVTPSDFDFVFDTNTRGVFFVAQEVAKRMVMCGNGTVKPGYRIINIASMAGLKTLPQIGIYSMSKAAVIHMTKTMAQEWGRHGINVNAICPAYIDTELNHHHWKSKASQKLLAMLPRRRVWPMSQVLDQASLTTLAPGGFHRVIDLSMSLLWGDMEAFGHVNNTVYFRFMEEVRISWFRQLAIAGANVEGQGLVIVNASMEFLRQLHYPSDVIGSMFVGPPGRSSFDTRFDSTPGARRNACGSAMRQRNRCRSLTCCAMLLKRRERGSKQAASRPAAAATARSSFPCRICA